MCVRKQACVVMREWVGAEKEVVEKVEVKTEQQKATATDERKKKRGEDQKTEEGRRTQNR